MKNIQIFLIDQGQMKILVLVEQTGDFTDFLYSTFFI